MSPLTFQIRCVSKSFRLSLLNGSIPTFPSTHWFARELLPRGIWLLIDLSLSARGLVSIYFRAAATVTPHQEHQLFWFKYLYAFLSHKAKRTALAQKIQQVHYLTPAWGPLSRGILQAFSFLASLTSLLFWAFTSVFFQDFFFFLGSVWNGPPTGVSTADCS